jgi:ubiquinone/menaquinone biosynthesis C-methylase UbiE
MKKMIKPVQNNPETKKKQVTKMFDGISKRYDILNRIITIGNRCFVEKESRSIN